MSARHELKALRDKHVLSDYLDGIWRDRGPHAKWIRPRGKWPIERTAVLRFPARASKTKK